MNKKSILHYHGTDFNKFYKRSNLKPLIKYILSLPSKIVVFSNTEKNQISSLCNTRTEVIPNFIDVKIYKNKKSKSKKKKVLFAGNLDKTSGIGDMLKAIPLVVKKNPNVALRDGQRMLDR